ncbi:START domain-containing protein [Dyadobacter luteus]|jgi:peptidoglycan/xylan/chitin deacetylase (PgdA/CDA1 family)|nr:START domain-containing protein [Dyadobacter luteus]
MHRIYYMLFFLLQCGNMVSAQSDWRLIAEDEGISVFSKSVSTSKVKAVKVECTLEASASQLVTLLMDLPVAIQWVSHTKSCTLVKRISPSELYYYSEVALPWPLENRDFVAHVRVTQDAITKVVTMNAPAVPGWVNENKGVVRIRKSLGYWTITPLAGNKVQVQYTLQVDPGGIIPAWMVNMLAAQGPMESFKNMRQQIRLPRYHNVSLPFITN